MQINFFIHDCFLEIGHSRAMIEVLRRLKEPQLKRINIVCFTSDSSKRLFPNTSIEVTIEKIPFPNLKPFLLKSLFFQIYTWLFKKRWMKKENLNITMGVCSFIGDIVNVQFLHHIWEEVYFEVNKVKGLTWLYKKILLKYLTQCESFYFRKKGLKFAFLSQFIGDQIISKYNLKKDDFILAYSSADFEIFRPLDSPKNEMVKSLSNQYPQLESLNLQWPILLFIGAYERKGLPILIQNLPKNVNLIVIGRPEATSQFKLKKSWEKQKIISIHHSKEIYRFYQLADAFIFPTKFEPFGLVILEAAASGLEIFVTKNQVGASEILTDFPGIHFLTSHLFSEQLGQIKPLDYHQKLYYSKERKKKLSQLNWDKCAEKWSFLISLLDLSIK